MLVPRRCELRLLSPARGVQTPRLNIGNCERPQGYESTFILSEQWFGKKTVEGISVPQAKITYLRVQPDPGFNQQLMQGGLESGL